MDHRREIIQAEVDVDKLFAPKFQLDRRRITRWKQLAGLKADDTVTCVLACDALFVKKNTREDEDGNLTNVIERDLDEFTSVSEPINSAFAYILVPVCRRMKPLLLHF